MYYNAFPNGGNALKIAQLTLEGNYNEAIKILFSLHKTNMTEWIKTKDCLLSMAGTSIRLNSYATLIEVSMADFIEDKAHLIPGVSGIDYVSFYEQINYKK